MKVLAVAAPLVGHLTPLLPLAAALRGAGHEVLIATGGDAAAVDTGGIPVRDLTGPVPMGRIAAPIALAHPRLIALEMTGRAGTRMVGHLFGAVAARMADGAVALARQWRPDLVLFESLAASGALAAAVVGVPAVLQESNLVDGDELLAVTAADARLRRVLDRYGVEALRPALTVRTGPPSVVGERPGPRMRAVPSSGAGELPPWLAGPGSRPRVLVSHSTIGPSGGDPTASVVAVAERVDAEFVLVRGRDDRRLPPNVRATGWVPLDRALEHADALVHHGGAGSLVQALACGVPQLVVPGAGDRRHNAELVARRGVGLARPARRISADDLTRLVGDAALREAAEDVAAEIAALPEPASLVPTLEALTR
ncbi:glycosyltransferase [Pseudonocardia lacus]|uniref:glycosyltransferase n=1 Tax=Pseudonocardia lacus TaxID=2835865 RepID=UPI001BDDB1E2|nr:glycosyltransferase [Pseudonocardia lacus]